MTPHRRGLLLFAAILAIALIAGWYFLRSNRDLARRASGAGDLKGVLFKCAAFAADHQGLFPPLDAEIGRLMFDRLGMSSYPYSATVDMVTMDFDLQAKLHQRETPSDANSNSDPDLINDHSMWYLGYRVTNEEEGRALARAYLEHAFTGKPWPEELTYRDNGDHEESITLPRLREDFFRDGIRIKRGETRAEFADIAIVLIERPGHYLPTYTGGWVCYLDGNAEFIEYPGKFPMTREFMGMLETIDAVGEFYGYDTGRIPDDQD